MKTRKGSWRGSGLVLKACRANIGAGAGQHHAVDRIQQRADVREVWRTGGHQRQRTRHFGHRAKISLTDQLKKLPSQIDSMR